MSDCLQLANCQILVGTFTLLGALVGAGLAYLTVFVSRQ